MATPDQILADLFKLASKDLSKRSVKPETRAERIEYVCRCLSNRAGVRLLMACLLAKIHKPEVDPRKPYTEIGGRDSFSGRTYDEQYIAQFIVENHLPCNSTTAFLTPALRNVDRPLSEQIEIIGRPRKMYTGAIKLLEEVAEGKIEPRGLLTDIIRILLQIRAESSGRIDALLAGLKQREDFFPLSSEQIVTLIQQHLACKNASRLPVLIVAAAYQAASQKLEERIIPLTAHNAADEQTHAGGDVEIQLIGDDNIKTVYEMKMRRVTKDDIDRALQKIAGIRASVDNYIFITTEPIDLAVWEYATGLYDQIGGREVAILDCVGFLRHFLHLFHRLRGDFLNAYQALVLGEPDSAVSQPLKEALLALRQVAEADT